MVIEIEIEANEIKSITSVAIPKSREILKFTGDLNSVKNMLMEYQNKYPLTTFIEIEIQENEFDVLKIQAMEDMIDSIKSEEFKILKNRIFFDQTPYSMKVILNESRTIQDLTPMDIFRQKLSENNLNELEMKELTEIYVSLIEEIQD
ncbi:MAG: exonuclease SbcCD subunit D C-terminal domain-containing protein [Saprospiraceae bacterium]|nr:exonuclease SbcCD subunit D C-terminal domain-containing protein [Saprospiraceae bacterium]